MSFTFTEPEYKYIGLFVANLLTFAEDGARITDAQSLLDLKAVLEETYTDGITAIKEVRVEEDNLVGIFEDKVSDKLIKRYNFTVNEDEVSFKLQNPNSVENYAESVDFAAKKRAEPKDCPKGTPCGGTCISKLKTCRKSTSAGAKAKVTEVKKRAGGSSSSTQISGKVTEIINALGQRQQGIQDRMPMTPKIDELVKKHKKADLLKQIDEEIKNYGSGQSKITQHANGAPTNNLIWMKQYIEDNHPGDIKKTRTKKATGATSTKTDSKETKKATGTKPKEKKLTARQKQEEEFRRRDERMEERRKRWIEEQKAKQVGSSEETKTGTDATGVRDWDKIDRTPKSSMRHEDPIVEVPSGTYQREKNGEKIKIKVSEQKDNGTQDIKINGVPEIYTQKITEARAFEVIDHYSSPMLGSRGELGSAYELRSRPPIKSLSEFEQEFDEAYKRLKEHDSNRLVRTYKLRRALGDRLTREDFDNYFIELAAKDKYAADNASFTNGNEDKRVGYDSMKNELEGWRLYVERKQE